MQNAGKILFVSAIVLLIVGSVGLPTTLGFYGQMSSGQNHMMQTTAGQCQHMTGNMHQEICQNATANCPGTAHHGMMDDEGFKCGSWCNTTMCNFTVG